MMLPQREITYSIVPDLREILRPGEVRKAVIKEYNKEENILKVSVKETTPHPFVGIETRHFDIVNNSWHIFLKHSHTYAAISNES